MISVTYILLIRQVYFAMYKLISLTFFGDPCQGVKKLEQQMTVLLACNVDCW